MRRPVVLVAGALAGGFAVGAAGPASAGAAGAKPKRPAFAAQATVRSVDGPGRLTLATKRGAVKVRLAMIETPEPGECGAVESTAVLRKLTDGRRGRVRYVLWSTRPDAEGRWPVVVGPRRADLIEDSLGGDLVAREWAQALPAVRVSTGESITFSVARERWIPRTLRGLWARCGGRVHLPATEPVPPNAPAAWSVDADGITGSIGPIPLPQTAPEAAAFTVADVARLVYVEATDFGQDSCWARIPSLQLVLWADTMAKPAVEAAPATKTKPAVEARPAVPRKPCGQAPIVAITSSGPGNAVTTNGLAAGQTAAQARALFPKVPRLDEDLMVRERLPLAGASDGSRPWQTQAALTKPSGRVIGFLAAPEAWN